MVADNPKNPNLKIPKQTKEQINEVVNPSLSRDSFKLGDKEIPIQILPIDDEERLVGIFLPAIKDLLSGMPEKVTAKEVIAKLDLAAVSKYAGILKEIITLMAQRHEPAVTKDFVGQNIHTGGMVSAIIVQLEKNQVADMVTNFFFKLATMLPKGEEKNPPSPQS
jgi:hypothetical protein